MAETPERSKTAREAIDVAVAAVYPYGRSVLTQALISGRSIMGGLPTGMIESQKAVK